MVYLSKAGSVDRVQLPPGTEVKVVIVDCAAGKTDALLVVVVALQPDSVRKYQLTIRTTPVYH